MPPSLQYHRYIEIAIKQCRSSGIDCKIHGLGIVGRIRAEDEDLATVPFLASDNEEEDDDKTVTGRYAGLKGDDGQRACGSTAHLLYMLTLHTAGSVTILHKQSRLQIQMI